MRAQYASVAGPGKRSALVIPPRPAGMAVAGGRSYLETKNPEIAIGVKYSRVIDLLSSPSKVKEKTGIWLVPARRSIVSVSRWNTQLRGST